MYVQKSMGKRMFSSFNLLLFMFLCFAAGCLCKGQWWKIDGQPGPTVFDPSSVLFNPKTGTADASPITAAFAARTTTPRQPLERRDGWHHGWNIRRNVVQKPGIWKRSGGRGGQWHRPV